MMPFKCKLYIHVTMTTIAELKMDIDKENRTSFGYMDLKMPKGGKINILIKTFICCIKSIRTNK